jgi:DcaP outer membrane protein
MFCCCRRYVKTLCCTIILCVSVMHIYSQTEFDSLKRNSNLDSSFQPSQKPTFVTEYAEGKISGFIQPALYFDFNNFLDNDLFITSAIPTEKVADVIFNRFHFSANQSRLGFSFKFPKAGTNTTALLQGDFLSSATGANTYFRLRHAYLTYGEFLAGQTWTNFGDVSSSPNTLDLEGPNSMPASRVAQVRWERNLSKKWSILFALEEPKNDYTPLDSASAIKAGFPEIVFKPKHSFRNGTWTNSFTYKPIVYTDKEYSFKRQLPAWGFTSSLSIKIGENTIHPLGLKKRVFNLFGIIGDGTQGSVNDFGGLGYEAFPKDDKTLETLLFYGGYASYSFVFRKRWSSNYVFSYLHQEKPLSTNQIFKHSVYISGNAVLAINKYFTTGLELLYGYKANHDNTSGSAVRLLGIMRLLF